LRRIRWAPAAADDLQSISDYLHEHRPSLANPTVRKIYDSVRLLKRFPYRGRLGQQSGKRELVLAPLPYIVLYDVTPEVIYIYRVVHTSENWLQ
jgi:addiction module RelE/StbE family toxin